MPYTFDVREFVDYTNFTLEDDLQISINASCDNLQDNIVHIIVIIGSEADVNIYPFTLHNIRSNYYLLRINHDTEVQVKRKISRIQTAQWYDFSIIYQNNMHCEKRVFYQYGDLMRSCMHLSDIPVI